MHTTEGAGWADCAVSPGPFYEPEFLPGARAVITGYLVPMLTAAPAVTAARVQAIPAPVKGHQMAKAALEMAILDAELRASPGRNARIWRGASTHVRQANRRPDRRLRAPKLKSSVDHPP